MELLKQRCQYRHHFSGSLNMKAIWKSSYGRRIEKKILTKKVELRIAKSVRTKYFHNGKVTLQSGEILKSTVLRFFVIVFFSTFFTWNMKIIHYEI